MATASSRMSGSSVASERVERGAEAQGQQKDIIVRAAATPTANSKRQSNHIATAPAASPPAAATGAAPIFTVSLGLVS